MSIDTLLPKSTGVASSDHSSKFAEDGKAFLRTVKDNIIISGPSNRVHS